MFDVIINGINTVKGFLPKGNKEVMNMVTLLKEFISGLQLFMLVLSADAEEILDHYCRGMIFGLEGTKFLSQMAIMVRRTDREMLEE